MTRLILIRHGETDYSLERRYCGFADPSLNSNGLSQVQKLADSLEGITVDKVYSSDLKRAYETAGIVFRDQPIDQISDFREINFGSFEGLRFKEAVEKYPKLYRDWIDHPESIKIPEGESLSELNQRVLSKLASILSENDDKTIALVAHGGSIGVIFCSLLNLGLEKIWDIRQDLSALNIIDYPKGQVPIVIKRNDTTHLLETKG